MTTDAREREIAAIMRRPYRKLVFGDPDEGYCALVLEFPGCITAGDTEEEALANLREAMAGWLDVALDGADAIPEPRPTFNPWPGFVVFDDTTPLPDGVTVPDK